MLTWLLLLNNLFRLCTEMNGLSNLSFQSDMGVFLPALEKKPVLMEKTTGVFSESINSRKLSNLLLQSLKIRGKFTNKWSLFLKSIIKLWTYLTELSILFLALSMMQLLKSTIFKLGSQDIILTENSYLARTVLTSKLEI